jgi:hypothetical protein
MLRKILILSAIACGVLVFLTAVDKYDERSCDEGRGFQETYGHCDGFLPW